MVYFCPFCPPVGQQEENGLVTQSQRWLSFLATLTGDQWRGAGCDSTSRCRVLPCCSILSGCWPGADLVLGNESSGIALLLEAGLALVSRSSWIWCLSAPTSLRLSIPGSPQRCLESWRKKGPSPSGRLIFHHFATSLLVPEALSLPSS